ncbi:MAG TPA: putative porin [bacterium]|nr:putative porin [bacterium]
MKRFWLLALLMAGMLALPLGSSASAQDEGTSMDDINSALGSMSAHMNDIDKQLKLKFFGDVRLRYAFIAQSSSTAGTTIADQSLGRYRARFGAAMTSGDFTGKIRIATGSNNSPWSQNNTFDTGMVTPFLTIDTAQIDWKPSFANGMLLVTAGKMGNPLTKSVITWDPDIQPEGALIQFQKSDFTLRATYFELVNQAPVTINGVAQKWDFFMDNVQAEYDIKMDKDSLGIMVGYEYIPNTTLLAANGLGFGSTTVFTSGVTDPGGVYRDFNVVEGMLTFKSKLGDVPMKWTLHMTDNLNGMNLPIAGNVYSSTFTNQYAWLLGVDFGQNKEVGEFAAGVFAAQVDPNAQLPTLVDDDSGRTNTQYLSGYCSTLLDPGVTLKLTQWVNGKEYYALISTASKHNPEFRTYLDCIVNL